MPFQNEHRARLKDPKLFKKDKKYWGRTHGGTIFGSKKIPTSIDIIWGQLKTQSGKQAAPQSLAFPIKRWTVVKAKAWLKRNKVKYILFEKAKKARESRGSPVAQACQYGLIENLEIRNVDKEKREITFVAATEGGVRTWTGREYLRMSGIRLQRFRKNPVILDAHRTDTVDRIVGSGKVKTEDRKLILTATFAQTERGEIAWQLASGGFLKAVSVGFFPNHSKTIHLEEGETDGKGEHEIKGPAEIIKEWELAEISVVPVPADEDAIRRALSPLSMEQGRLIRLFNNVFSKEDIMEFDKWLKERGFTDPDSLDETQTESLRALFDQTNGAEEEIDDSSADSTEQKPASKPKVAPLPGEIRAREIRAMTPRGLEEIADRCIIENKSVEDARKLILDEFTKRTAPVGTPAPQEPGKPGDNKEEKKLEVNKMDDAAIKRALVG